MNPAEGLWDSHEPEKYPKGVKRIPTPIVGTSFFPGGFGLWNPKGQRPLPAFPVGGVMILGHDFHSEVGYQKSLEGGCENLSQPTWANLLKLLKLANIEPQECFFTNVYMGLREGTATMGPFPGRTDKAFVAHCKQFLTRQIDAQRPSLIVTLGKYVPQFLSSLSNQLTDWGSDVGFKSIDISGPVRKDVAFDEMPGYSAVVVALTHPSLRGPNLRHREYGGLKKQAAELLMLLEARDAAALRPGDCKP